MTTEKLFQKMRVDSRCGYATGLYDISKKTLNELKQKAEQFKQDAEIDKELEVITEQEYETEIKRYELMQKAFEFATTI